MCDKSGLSDVTIHLCMYGYTMKIIHDSENSYGYAGNVSDDRVSMNHVDALVYFYLLFSFEKVVADFVDC